MDAQLLTALLGQLSLGGPRLTYGDDPAAVLFQGRPDLARLTPPLLYSLPHHLLFLELEGLFSTQAFLPPVAPSPAPQSGLLPLSVALASC